MITFEDLNLIFYILVFRTTIKLIMKKIYFEQQFATTSSPLTQKVMGLVYRSTFWVHFTMFAPTYVWDLVANNDSLHSMPNSTHYLGFPFELRSRYLLP